MVSEGSYATTCVILQKFEVEKCSTTLGEATEDLFPSALILEAMRKLDMCVLEGDCGLL